MDYIDACAMAEAVRKKQVSPEELVQESIAKIETENPKIHAVTSTRFEKALMESKNRLFTNQPFFGVPLLLKDLGQEQVGEPSTAGSTLFADYRASQSDNYVKALENLGFIILGRTSTPEFGFKNISDSQLHGAVRLPFDLTRNAGGSSGGAAASVSSGMVPLAAASDGGGSIRIPASFNGLIGLKPTRGRIPVGPHSFRGWQGASVNFALTKTVRDTKHLLYHFQTCQMESPFVLPLLTKESLFARREKKVLKIGVSLQSPIGSNVSEDAQQAVRQAMSFLESFGHELVELKQDPLDGVEAMQSYYLMNSVETAQMFDGIEANLKRPLTPDDMELMTWAIYRSGQHILGKDYSHALQKWDQYSHQMALFHQEYDIYLTPTTNQPAPLLEEFLLSDDLKTHLRQMDSFSVLEQQELIWQMFEKSLAWTPFTQQANLTGQPSISLPTYETKSGLPMGIQLTAAKGREDLLLSLAEVFESQNQFVTRAVK